MTFKHLLSEAIFFRKARGLPQSERHVDHGTEYAVKAINLHTRMQSKARDAKSPSAKEAYTSAANRFLTSYRSYTQGPKATRDEEGYGHYLAAHDLKNVGDHRELIGATKSTTARTEPKKANAPTSTNLH